MGHSVCDLSGCFLFLSVARDPVDVTVDQVTETGTQAAASHPEPHQTVIPAGQNVYSYFDQAFSLGMIVLDCFVGRVQTGNVLKPFPATPSVTAVPRRHTLRTLRYRLACDCYSRCCLIGLYTSLFTTTGRYNTQETKEFTEKYPQKLYTQKLKLFNE